MKILKLSKTEEGLLSHRPVENSDLQDFFASSVNRVMSSGITNRWIQFRGVCRIELGLVSMMVTVK